MRDHGGNIDRAIACHGGAPENWIDLSTGINRVPWPRPDLADGVWTMLPTRAAQEALTEAARAAWGVPAGAGVLALAGAQGAIQLAPLLRPAGLARVLAPTYNEHAAALRLTGWVVEEVADLAALRGADFATVVNPNNPDGRRHDPQQLLDLAEQVGLLVVDESFGDAHPEESLCRHAGRKGLLVLRSFGKFYGLAGVRLGFAIGHAADIGALAALAGPWPVSGPALEIGRLALADREWAAATVARLREDAALLDAMAAAQGWAVIGGTELFRLYDTPDGLAAQQMLARGKVWSRVFPAHPRWIRLGLPGGAGEWAQLRRAFGQG